MVSFLSRTFNNFDCQLWKIESVHPSVPNGTYTIKKLNDGTYTIKNTEGKALTVENGSDDNGANIILAETNGDISQKFHLQCNKDGSYSLRTAASNGTACADVFEISMENGANICQWEYWGGAGQKFILESTAAETVPQKIIGDVNADGKFSVADIVMMQKFLLGSGELIDWAAGDICKDGKIDAFDMVMMRKLIISEMF